MSRLAVLLLTALALALCASPALADVPKGAELIDEATLTPNGGDAGGVWHSKVLEPEVEYTVIVSGSYTEPYGSSGTRSYDGLYCGGSATSDSACGRTGGSAIRKPSVLFQAGPTGRTKAYDGIDDLGGVKGKLPESVAGYEAKYTFAPIPGAASDYRLVATILTGGACPACSGELRVRVYGPVTAKYGVVNLRLLQQGLPKRHSEDLVRSTSSAKGGLRLTQPLDGDRGHLDAKVVPKSGMTLVHGDQYAIADDEALIAGVTGGTYYRIPQGQILQLDITVLQSTDADCPEESEGRMKIFDPARGSTKLPYLAMDLCDGHVHVFKRLNSGGTVHVSIRLHEGDPSPARRARLL